MRFVHFWVTLCCLSVAVLRMSVSITVKFPQKEPLHVKLGQTLVLEAQIQLQQNERIELRTWELRNSNGEVRVAEGDKTYNNRTSIEKNGALLRIKGVVNSDYGIYKITVTSNNADQVSDSRQVLKITNPPNASLSMHCSVPTQGARWDNPSFLWQVDGIKVTNETGEISEDGSSLRLVNLGHSYTCISMSSQGESQVQVLTIEPTKRPDTDTGCYCTGWIVVAVIESIAIGCLIIGGYIWYKRNITSGHAERTQTL